ncbi:MAG: O-antigen ligase family protein, partial [Armatimonadota bacterium]
MTVTAMGARASVSSLQRAGAVARSLTLLAVVTLAVAAPLLPPIAWKVKATLLAGLLAAAGALLRLQREGSVGRSALDRPALALLAAATLATVFSVDPLVSFFPSRFRGEGLVVFIPYVVLSLAAARLTAREGQRLTAAMLAGGVIIALTAVAQYYGADPLLALGFRSVPPIALTGPNPVELRLDSVWTGSRGWGTLANPIFLGAYVALLLPLAAALTLQVTGRAAWAYGAAALMLYAALVASETRSAWIGAAVAALVLIRLVPKPTGALLRGALLAAGFIVVTAVLVLTRPDASPLRRASATFGANDYNDYSMRQKLYVWKHMLPLIAQRPLLGWGFSTLIGQFTDLGSPEYLSVFGDAQIVLIDSPHNELLHVAYSAGLLGLAAYLWVWTAAGRGLLRRLRAAASTRTGDATWGLGAGLAASLVAYFIWMQFGWNVIGPANVFWVILGLA